jgi:hypothetical protein
MVMSKLLGQEQLRDRLCKHKLKISRKKIITLRVNYSLIFIEQLMTTTRFCHVRKIC